MPADLTLLDLLDARPAPCHANDPATSRIAAGRVKVGPLQRQVLMALYRRGEHGATAEEVATVTGLTPPSAGTRVGELRRAGLVVTTDERRDTFGGNPALVHVLSADGRVLAAQLARTL